MTALHRRTPSLRPGSLPALSLALSAFLFALPATAGDLPRPIDVPIVNGSFESPIVVGRELFSVATPTPWDYVDYLGGYATWVVRDATAAEGDQYIEMEADAQGADAATTLVQEVTLNLPSHASEFALKVKVRHNDVQPDANASGFRLGYQVRDASGVWKWERWTNLDLHTELTSEWQEVTLNQPSAQSVDPNVRVAMTVRNLGTDPDAAIHIDDVRIEFTLSHDMMMKPLREKIVIANNLVIPNWFITLGTSNTQGNQRIANQSAYYFDLPAGVSIPTLDQTSSPAFGAHPDATGYGNAQGVYTSENLGDVLHENEWYTRWKFVPVVLHPKHRHVGALYLESSWPEGSVDSLYFYTTWMDGEVEMASYLERVDLVTRSFPNVGRVTGMPFTLAAMNFDLISWPDALDVYEMLGFNMIASSKGGGYYLHPDVIDLVSQANARGFMRLYTPGGFNATAISSEAKIPTTGNTSPCYRDEYVEPPEPLGPFQTDLERMRDFVEDFEPHHLWLDIENYGPGAQDALDGLDPFCHDELVARGMTQEQMPELLITMGTDLLLRVKQRLSEDPPLDLMPEMSTYRASPNFVYQHLFSLEDLLARDAADLGQPICYMNDTESCGINIRADRAAESGGYLIPYFDTGSVSGSPDEARAYDILMELFGSGVRGAAWFAFRGTEGLDLYYGALAMQAIRQVESIIPEAQPAEDVQSLTPGARATAIRSGKNYVLLVSAYDDPQLVGTDVVIDLGRPVLGRPIDLANNQWAGDPVIWQEQVTVTFDPSLAGAHTALYYLCDVWQNWWIPCQGPSGPQ